MYCVKCRAKIPGQYFEAASCDKNSRPVIKSQCSICGKWKWRSVNQAKNQSGGSLESLFAPLIKKVTVTVVKDVSKKVIQALRIASLNGAMSGAIHSRSAN